MSKVHATINAKGQIFKVIYFDNIKGRSYKLEPDVIGAPVVTYEMDEEKQIVDYTTMPGQELVDFFRAEIKRLIK